MTESPSSPITPIDRMKQWVFDKLQKDVSLDDPSIMNTGPKRESLSGPVPRIVISEEGFRSPRYPVLRGHKPSPLKRTWINYDLESPATNLSPTGAIKPVTDPVEISPNKTSPKSKGFDTTSPCKTSPTFTGQKTWLNYSPRSPLSVQGSPKSQSLPVSPPAETARLFWSATCNKDLESPLLKYAVKGTAASDSQSTIASQSPVQDINPFSSRLESPIKTPIMPKAVSKNIPTRQNSTLSCKSDGIRSHQWIRKDTLRMTGSHNDLQKKVESDEPLSFNRVSDKNTVLTRSWSTNLDPDTVMRNDSTKSGGARKISLNETELSRTRRRRRSSILSFLCLDKEVGDDSSDESARSDAATSAKFGEKIEKDAETDDELQQVCSGTQYLEQLHKGVPIGGLSAMFDLYKHPREWGAIKIRFQYFSKAKRFQVSLVRGRNIGRGREKNLNLFVKVCLMPGKLQQKKGQSYHDSHDPVFYETFNFTKLTLGDLVEKRLRVRFYNKVGLVFEKEPLGEAVVPLFNYDLTAATVTWQHLRRCDGQKVCTLTFYLCLWV